MALQKKTRQRVLVGVLATTALVLAVVAVLFVYGTPQSSPSASGASALSEGEATSITGGAGATYEAGEVAADAKAPPADPNSPLAIEIPGCVCHSDDPELVESHSEYRMNQCAGCHLGGVQMGK